MPLDPFVSHEEFVESGDGQRLFLRSWRPDAARASLAVVHGFNSHGGFYGRFAQTMASRGIATYAIDLRGRGKSSGPRYFVRQFADYVDDIRTLVSTIRVREPARPVFMLGHSAGGVAACLYALDNPQDLAGLICESFALEVPAPAVEVQILRALARLAPRLPVLKLRNERYSRDPGVVTRMNDDALIKGERQPAATLAAMFRASARLRSSARDFELPLLILHGSADVVTLPSGSEFFHENAGSHDKTLQIFESYYHDLVNDQGHELVVEKIFQWIEARLSAGMPQAQIGISYINAGP